VDRFRELQTLVAVADCGGFAKAAARLHTSPPVITRIIASLEQRLGVQLFNRTTRSVHPTEAGIRFLVRARALLGDLDAVEKEAAGHSGLPTGHLTITAPATMGRQVLSPIVTAFLDAHAHMTAQVILLDRVVNMIDEGVDVALRVGQLPDSTLVARQIGEVRRVCVAGPSYVAKHGAPKEPADLKRHSVIAFTGLPANSEWSPIAGAKPRRIETSPRFEINDAAAAISAAEKGEGITVALSYMVAASVKARRLVVLLDAFAPRPVPVHLVFPESRLVASKVRAFVDYAAPRLRTALQALIIKPA
jgi:DNA-binding transcriptional LysR family regulator